MSKKAITSTEFETALKSLKVGDWVQSNKHINPVRVQLLLGSKVCGVDANSTEVQFSVWNLSGIWKGKSAPKSTKPSKNWIYRAQVAETAVEKKEAKPKKTTKRVTRDNWDAEEVIKFLQKRTSRPLPGAEFPPTESEQEALRLLEEANHVICRLRDDQSQAHSFMQSAINRLKVK